MQKRSPLFQLLLFIGLLTLVWFALLDVRHLIPSDEGRYAEIAREMYMTGDWITPRYNGYLYFEKPPLQTWFNALTFYLFGLGDWQARLYTALSSFAGIFLIALTGRLVFKNTLAGLYAALILASAPHWNLLGHFNTLDTGLSFWMTVTLCSLLLAQRSGITLNQQRYWMWGCWAAMALSVLSKGLIGLALPGAVLVLYSVALRDWRLWRRLHLLTGGILFLLLTLPWFALVEKHNPGFADFFFVVQHFRRYLTPEQHRPGAWYYFIPVLVVGFLPWLSLAVSSIWRTIRGACPIRDLPHRKFLARQANGFSPIGLLLTWSLFIFVFFSASHSKLISYTLPIVPSIALLLGLAATHFTEAQWRRHLSGAMAAISLFLAGLLAFQITDYFFVLHIGSEQTPHCLYSRYFLWTDVALLIVLLGSFFARSSLPVSSDISMQNQTGAHSTFAGNACIIPLNRLLESPLSKALLIYASAWILGVTVAGSAHEIFGKWSSGSELVPAIQAQIKAAPAKTPFYSVRMLDHTLPFYLRHTMIMVEHPDELRYGITQEPEKWVPTLQEWMVRWRQQPHAFALLSPALYGELAAKDFPMQVIARDSRRVVVCKP